MVLQLFTLLGALGMFLYGMNLISFPLFLKLIGWITAGIFGVPNPAASGFAVEVMHDADGLPIQTPSQIVFYLGNE